MIKVKRGNEIIPIGRVIGGFAWPGVLPGYCCVIGEAEKPEITQRAVHQLFLLDETKKLETLMDKMTLIRQAAAFQTKYGVLQWFGRGFNDWEGHNLLYHWNTNVRTLSSTFYPEIEIFAALNSEKTDINYHLDILETCMVRGEEILFNTTGTRFQEEAMTLSNDRSELTCDNYPAVAGVAYAVSMLRNNPPSINKQKANIDSGERTMTGY